MFGLHRLPILLALIPGVIIGGGLGLVIYDDNHKIGLPPQRSLPADQKPVLIVGILGFLISLMAIGFGFDAIDGEHNRRTLSRILAQPIYRDALLAGKFIAGHQSRQDASTLRQVAVRLSGTYHNGNEKHLPTVLLIDV